MSTPEIKIALLEQNQATMANEISEIKEIVKSFDAKLDKALEKKADISMVEGVQKNVDSVRSDIRWAAYIIIGSVIAGILAMLYK